MLAKFRPPDQDGSWYPNTNNQFHHVVLTDSPGGRVSAYLDGRLELTVLTDVMDINNPQNLMNFFLDNVTGGFEDEYSSGRIALLRVYEGALTSQEVANLARDPFGNIVPEPGTFILFGLGAIGLVAYGRRHRRRA